MYKFKLKILTPNEKLFSGEVTQVVLPTKAGEITVLANHIPLISLLSIGEIKVLDDNKKENKFLVQGGVIDVKQKGEMISEVVILADQKISKDNFDEKVFLESVDRAKKANTENNSDFDFETFESEIERSNYFKNLKR